MNGAFYIGAVGLDAQQRALDVVSNNIANINTVGFKRSAIRFHDLVAPSERVRDASLLAIRGDANPLGVTSTGASHIWTQGDLRQTGQAMDLAIDGDGFIEIMGPAGETLLWRGGALKVSADGYLAANDGTPLHAMISVPRGATAVTIGRDGIVTAQLDGEEAPTEIGRIDLLMVNDKDDLQDVGGGYYRSMDNSNIYTVAAQEEGAGALIQGALEGANVELSDEMVSLLLTQRAYAVNAQVVQAGDQLMSIINNLRR